MSNELSLKEQISFFQGQGFRNLIKNTFQNEKAVGQVVSAIISNPALVKCSRESIMGAVIAIHSLGLDLDPNTGQSYIIPFKDKAQLQVGWKGWLTLAMRNPNIKIINAGNVKQGELTGLNRLTGEYTWNWNADIDARNKLPTMGYFAYIETKDGKSKTIYMSKETMTQHAIKYSQTFAKGYGLWKDQFELMSYKTILKKIIRESGMITDTYISQALKQDQAVVKADINTGEILEQVEYVDNDTKPTDQEKVKVEIQ